MRVDGKVIDRRRSGHWAARSSQPFWPGSARRTVDRRPSADHAVRRLALRADVWTKSMSADSWMK